ncbi:hypothetical protein SARC_16822, partial [Sphaeroforma arctica JP610]
TNVARNAVTENADSSFGQSDPNIEGGLSVEFACERILAGVQNGVDVVWIAGPLEKKLFMRASTCPSSPSGLLRGQARR